MWKWKYETTLFYLNRYYYGKCFFSSTCSSNSVDVDDDYCRWWWWWCWWYCVQPKESEYVARLEMTWLQWLQLVSSCMTLHVRWDLSSDCISGFWEAKICEQKDSLHYEPTCGSSCLSSRTGHNCGFPFLPSCQSMCNFSSLEGKITHFESWNKLLG